MSEPTAAPTETRIDARIEAAARAICILCREDGKREPCDNCRYLARSALNAADEASAGELEELCTALRDAEAENERILRLLRAVQRRARDELGIDF